MPQKLVVLGIRAGLMNLQCGDGCEVRFEAGLNGGSGAIPPGGLLTWTAAFR
jgi:hypothetical protein